MAYNFMNDVISGYKLGSQFSKDYEEAQIKKAEDEYWKNVTNTKPTVTPPPTVTKPTIPGGYVPGKTISGQDTMLPPGAMSYDSYTKGEKAPGMTDVNSDVTTAPLTELAMVKDPYAEPPKDQVGGVISDASTGKEGAAPVEAPKPIMTQHMEAANVSKNLDNSLEQQKGLVKYLREKGYSTQAAIKEKELYDLQSKASSAKLNELTYQSKVLDEVGGVLNGYIKMAEQDPANEARYRAVGTRQLQNLGYDGNIIGSDDPKENIATAKQIYASTTTAKENAKFEIDARNATTKEENNRIRVKHNDAMDSLGNQKIALGRDKYDSKKATEILKSYDNEVNKLRTQYENTLNKDDHAMFGIALEKAIAAQAQARKDFIAQASREKVPFNASTAEAPPQTPGPTNKATAKPAVGVKFTPKAIKDVQELYNNAMKLATTEEQKKLINARMVKEGYIDQ